MSPRSSEALLGEADLARWRHVCGIFEGVDDTARAVEPFVTRAIERGERVVHLVADRDAYLRRMPDRAVAAAASRSGQLEVRTWSTTYLAGGRFGASKMRSTVRRALREGRALGFPAVRLIGDMGWISDDVPGAEELLEYEESIDALVARPDVSILCTYDVHRHSARRISQALGAHRAALIGGKLKVLEMGGEAPSARERILAAASALFSEDGVSRTGVDTLIAAARVAKATFYRQFPSKESLVVAWLQHPDTRWFHRVRNDVEARTAAPEERAVALFDAVAEWLEAGDFVGCPYLNTAVETDAAPVSAAIREYLAEIEDYLGAAATAAGQRDGRRAGKELQALLAGSIMLGVANRTTAHVLTARAVATRLLAAPG
jgi:AcrR family transcriptional regulator